MQRVYDIGSHGVGVITASLQGAPRKLFAICIAQTLVLVAGIFISRPKATCEVVHLAHSHYGIDCNRCHPTSGLYFGEFLMILGGVSVIAVGMYVTRDSPGWGSSVDLNAPFLFIPHTRVLLPTASIGMDSCTYRQCQYCSICVYIHSLTHSFLSFFCVPCSSHDHTSHTHAMPGMLH